MKRQRLPIFGGIVAICWLLIVSVVFSNAGLDVLAILGLFLVAVTWGVVWLVRLLDWFFRMRRGRLPSMSHHNVLSYWGLEPAAFALSVLLVVGGVPQRTRFLLSASALQSFVEEVRAGRVAAFGASKSARQVGLYRVKEAEVLSGGIVRFITSRDGLDDAGFAFSPVSEPPRVGEDSYSHLSGPWWQWHRSW